MTEKLEAFDMVALLDSDDAIKEYLYQVLNDGDSKELMRALGYVAKAKGMKLVTIAKKTQPKVSTIRV